jgi:hypothetical protein
MSCKNLAVPQFKSLLVTRSGRSKRRRGRRYRACEFWENEVHSVSGHGTHPDVFPLYRTMHRSLCYASSMAMIRVCRTTTYWRGAENGHL